MSKWPYKVDVKTIFLKHETKLGNITNQIRQHKNLGLVKEMIRYN